VNILRFLREQAKGYDCSVCGQNHARSDIRVLGKLESAWIVRVTCSKCNTSFKLLVVIDEERANVSPVQEPARRPEPDGDDGDVEYRAAQQSSPRRGRRRACSRDAK